MAGTREGGLRAAATNKKRYGQGFYSTIGARGGSNGTTGGWAKKTPCNCDLIRGKHIKPQCRGKLGGTNSSRGKAKTNL